MGISSNGYSQDLKWNWRCGVCNLQNVSAIGSYVGDDYQLEAAGRLAFEGEYLYVSHFLTGEFMPWNRQSGTLGRVKPLENFFSVRTCDQNIERGLGGLAGCNPVLGG